MEEEAEKMAALKKAYADIILNTAKESAARVLAAERKALGFQQSLFAAKEEALATMPRLKAIMEDKPRSNSPNPSSLLPVREPGQVLFNPSPSAHRYRTQRRLLLLPSLTYLLSSEEDDEVFLYKDFILMTEACVQLVSSKLDGDDLLCKKLFNLVLLVFSVQDFKWLLEKYIS